MILFWLRPGQVTTRDTVQDDVAARFPRAQYEMRLRASVAIDEAIKAGTLIERSGRLEAVNALRGWMLDLEIPPDEEPPVMRLDRRHRSR